MDREDMKHHISMLISEGQLHLAPIGPNPQLILDIGTGTGKFRSFKNHSGMIADKERHMGY
jgi:hypothetical protein